jgi:butyrate kinase
MAEARTPSTAAEALLTPLAHALLREEHGKVDAALPALIDAIKATGAAACWHKHSSFLSHLLGVHRIAALWAMPRDVCLMALAHSAYSNRRALYKALLRRA